MWWAGAEVLDVYLGGGRCLWSVAGTALGDTGSDGETGTDLPALLTATLRRQAGAEDTEGAADAADASVGAPRTAARAPHRRLGSRFRPPGAKVPGDIRPAGPPWRLWLGGDLARPFLWPELPRSASAAARDGVAQALARQALGLHEPCRVWLSPEARRGRGAALGVAVAEPVAADIERWCARHRVRLHGLAPWWSGALDASLGPGTRPASALAFYDARTLTMLAGTRPAVSTATAPGFLRARTAVDIATWADARLLWSRALAALDLDPADTALLALTPWAADAGPDGRPMAPGYAGPLAGWTMQCAD